MLPTTCPFRPPRTKTADAGTRAIALQGAMSSDWALATDVCGYIHRAGLRGNMNGPTSGQQIASNETTPATVAVFTEGHPETGGHVARIPKGRNHVRHRLLLPVNLHVLASYRSYNAQRRAYTLQEPLREFLQMTAAILRKFWHS